MSTQDLLNIVLIFGIVIITSCAITLTYFFVTALKAIENMVENIASTTENLKNGVGLKLLATIPPIFVALLSKVIKRGR